MEMVVRIKGFDTEHCSCFLNSFSFGPNLSDPVKYCNQRNENFVNYPDRKVSVVHMLLCNGSELFKEI